MRRRRPAVTGTFPPTVAVTAGNGTNPFELAVACEVFGLERPELGVEWYRFIVCAVDQPPYHPGCAGVYPVFATENDPAAALVPSTTPIDDLVDVEFATFVPPAGSGERGL